jgi:hypothetical protein
VNADRRKVHDVADDAEDDVQSLVDDVHQEWWGGFTERGQRDAEQDGEEQHLQQVVLRERVDHAVRDDVHDEFDAAGQVPALSFRV